MPIRWGIDGLIGCFVTTKVTNEREDVMKKSNGY